MTDDGVATYAYDLDSNSQLDSEWSGDTTITYGYDSRGNTLTKAVSGDGTTTYTYDDSNKLTKIEYPSGSTSSEYKYNGAGVRVKKVASDGTETYFIYDGNRVIMEVDTDGDAQATYTYGANGLISQKLGATSYYVGCDHLGSAWDVVTLDEDENVDVSYVYTAFGNTDDRSVRQGAADPNDAYRYVGTLGYYADADDYHGLMLLGARYYNPSVGRFITLDPIRDGMNWYVYVGNNPVARTDPTGFHMSEKCKKLCDIGYKADLRECDAAHKRCTWRCWRTGFGAFLGCLRYCNARWGRCGIHALRNYYDCYAWCDRQEDLHEVEVCPPKPGSHHHNPPRPYDRLW